jgi:hypothetical protein
MKKTKFSLLDVDQRYILMDPSFLLTTDAGLSTNKNITGKVFLQTSMSV